MELQLQVSVRQELQKTLNHRKQHDSLLDLLETLSHLILISCLVSPSLSNERTNCLKMHLKNRHVNA